MCVMNVCQHCCAGISCIRSMHCWTGENSAFLIKQKVGQEVKLVNKLTASIDPLVNTVLEYFFNLRNDMHTIQHGVATLDMVQIIIIIIYVIVDGDAV